MGPVGKGGQNLPPLVGRGLTDLQNIERGGGALTPLASPVLSAYITLKLNQNIQKTSLTRRLFDALFFQLLYAFVLSIFLRNLMV